MERGLTKQQIITTMTLSPHGDLSAYLAVCGEAARNDQEFAAHFTAYLAEKSQVRDINIAMPIICLAEPKFTDPEFIDNSLAHLAKLTPRELVAAYQFGKFGLIRNKDVVDAVVEGKKVKKSVGGWKSVATTKVIKSVPTMVGILQLSNRVGIVKRLIERYLRSREANHAWFERNAVQFRRDMQRLYFMAHVKPSDYAKAVLYDKIRPCGSALEAIKDLPRMAASEAASAIIEFRLPFLTIQSVLGEKTKDKLILMAMIDRMSSSELQTNMKLLEKLGMNDFPETRAAFEASLARLATKGATKTTLKTAKAISAVKSEATKQKLQHAQEAQLSNMKGVDGDWLVAADASGSMRQSIETARMVAGTLTKLVRGKVHLIFFNGGPLYIDVTGMTLDQINQRTSRVTAVGGTNIGCVMQYLIDNKLSVDGIALTSDGGENGNPWFSDRYKRYCEVMDCEPTLYFYKMKGNDADTFSYRVKSAGIDFQTFDLTQGVDEYSVVQLVQTMRVNRYSLTDEIMGSKLLTVDGVLRGSRSGELVGV